MRAFPKPIRLKCHRPGKNFIYVLSMPVLGNEELTGYYLCHPARVAEGRHKPFALSIPRFFSKTHSGLPSSGHYILGKNF